jgi:DNA modification methylase
MEKLKWRTEKRRLKDLVPYERNPRKADEKQVGDVNNSITKFGLAEPLIINTDGTMIGGHLRRKLLLEKGIEEEDVRVPNRKLTDKEVEELNLRLNKNQATWDFDILANFEDSLLQEVGFESEELDRIFQLESGEDDFNPEQEYENIKKSRIKLGEIYQLGKHRIMCGDATEEEDVKKLMGGKQADMVWTDAPYNMNYKSKKKGGILNDNMKEEKFVEFSEQFVARIKENLKSGGVFYMCSGYSSYIPFIYALKANNLEFANPIIWVKNQLGMGMNDYRHSHEMILKGKGNKKSAQPILYGWNEGKHYFINVHDEGDVWEIKKRATNTMVHPTQKPIELISRAIRNSSKRDQIVLDLFGGSFSTLISCEKEGRIFYGMDLDPKYVEIGIKRWQKLTGITDPPMV